ncbi:MAG: HRDC domain-containing protein [Syntrophomonadaceae bacterium]|nr:HRDC domain-containing protein [Syntrophomonadaceae bacterium]
MLLCRKRLITENIAVYMVFTNAELEALISKHPSSLEELMQVRGFGKKKAEKYGQDILQVFQEFG